MLSVKRRVTVKISICAIFSALASVISILHIEIPMPILTYLKFDFAEIPDYIAFYVAGFDVGVFTAFIHMLILNLYTEFPIIGPSAKFLAVVSMMLGTWIYWRIVKSLNSKVTFIGEYSLASVFRVLIMTLYNLLIFYVLMPNFLNYLPILLKPIFGSLSLFNAIIIVLALTGIYNIVHAFLTISISRKISDIIHSYFKI